MQLSLLYLQLENIQCIMNDDFYIKEFYIDTCTCTSTCTYTTKSMNYY